MLGQRKHRLVGLAGIGWRNHCQVWQTASDGQVFQSLMRPAIATRRALARDVTVPAGTSIYVAAP